MADFLIAYNITNKTEGGYTNDPDDFGGETYAGISRKNFSEWEGWAIVDANKPLHQGQIINDTALKVLLMTFYKQNFWNKINGDMIPLQDLANQEYDAAVNNGVGTALNLLKKS